MHIYEAYHQCTTPAQQEKTDIAVVVVVVDDDDDDDNAFLVVYAIHISLWLAFVLGTVMCVVGALHFCSFGGGWQSVSTRHAHL